MKLKCTPEQEDKARGLVLGVLGLVGVIWLLYTAITIPLFREFLLGLIPISAIGLASTTLLVWLSGGISLCKKRGKE